MFEYAVLMAFPALLAFGGAFDLLTMTIPNRISIALVALFPVAALMSGLSGYEVLMHAGAGLLVLTIGIALFAFGGFGGGDAKLLAAASLWIGFEQLLPFMLYMTIFGGALAILLLTFRRLPIPAASPGWALHLHHPETGIPYGIAIACAGLKVYPLTHWFAALTS